MASVSLSSLVRSLGMRFGELMRPVTRVYARLERGMVAYLTLTPSRRRASRLAGVGLFSLMTICFMGPGSCEACLIQEGVDPAFAHYLAAPLDILFNAFTQSGDGKVRPRFTGTDGSHTGVASFAGNFTGIMPPSGSYFVMVRQPDCTLGLAAANATNTGTSGTLTSTAVISNYERTLHQLAGLTTTPDVYPKGCNDPTLGISTRIGVVLQRQKSGPIVMATVQGYRGNNAIFVLSNKTDFSTGGFTPLAGTAAASAIATADLNGDSNGDLVAVNDYNAASPYVSVLISNGDGTFKTPVTYPTAGNMSVAATIADVNGDGKLDVVAVSDDQHISVLLGNGDGTFQAAQSFAVPALPGQSSAMNTPILGLIAADVNADGKKDIVCSNGLVLLGNGNGTFTAVSTPAFPYTTASPGGFGPQLASGDVNNDGKLDLVVDTGSTITVWTGKGDGTFTQGASYASINNSGYLTLTDLDGDGNLDIYTGLANGGLFSGDDTENASAYVLMGNGDGTFVGAAQAAAQGAYSGTNLGDVNGDGVPDLITNGTVNSPVATFTVQLSNGKGGFATASTFTAPSAFTLGGYTFSMAAAVAANTYAVADINGDGKADLVFVDNGLTVINPGNGFPITYPYPVYFTAISNGDGTFQTPVPHAFPQIAPSSGFDNTLVVTGLQIADVNHDGRNDLVFSYNETGGGTGVNFYNQGLGVLLNAGGGVFSTTAVLTSTYSSNTAPTTAFVPTVLSTADLNGDNKPDLVVNAPGTAIVNFQLQTLLQVYVGNGDGTFKAPTTLTTADQYGLPVVADFNKDGKMDLAWLAETSAAQAELVVASGNGDGTFGTPAVLNLTGGDSIRSAQLVGADFDGDSKVDLALFDANDFSGVFYGKGDGTFTSVPASGYIVPKDLINIAAGAPAVAVDLNKDGKPDILAGATVLLNLYGAAPVIPATTSLGLTASATTIAAGSSVKLTATVTPAAGSTATPTGTVTFFNGNTTIGTGTVTAGVATLTTSSLTTPGPASIAAQYSGDPNFNGSPSAALTVTVTSGSQAATLALTASPGNTSTVNQVVTFTATLGGVSFTPTAPSGNVTFTANGTAISGCSAVPVSGTTGKATCTTSALAPGADAIAATYAGDPTFTVAAPATVTQTVSAFAAGMSLGASPSSSTAAGTAVTFTATLTGTGIAFTPVPPSGKVAFTANGTTITGCGATAVSTVGTATCTTSTLAAGADAIAATYSGDTNFTVASPATATQTVTATAGFSLTPGAATITVAKGATTGNSTTITVAPSGGFTGSVALTAAVTASPSGSVNLPVPSFGATSPVVISGAGSGAGTLTVATTAPTSGAAVVPVRPGVRYAPVVLAGLLLLVLPRRRRGLGVMVLLLVALGGGLMACGGHPSSSNTGSPGTTSGNYTITVTATSGNVSAQTTVGVTVQ